MPLLPRRLRRPADGASWRSRLAAELVRRASASPTVGAVVQGALLQHPGLRGDPGRVHVDPSVVLNGTLLNTMSGHITVGPDAFFGDGVQLLTGTHDVSARGADRQHAIPSAGRDIVIDEGAWIASGVIVIGPCHIGAHAVVAAGAVVTADVAPGSTVAGIPARPRKT